MSMSTWRHNLCRPCYMKSRQQYRRQSSSASLSLLGNERTMPFASFFFRNDPPGNGSGSFSITGTDSPPGKQKRRRDSSITTALFSSKSQSQFPSQPQPLPVTEIPAGFKPIEALTTGRLLKVYARLSKSRLTMLNVLAAMTGVALCPLPTTVPVLLATALGTTLCSASANTLNQIQEVPFDAQMARTRNRPLARRVISPVHAATFALATGISGPALLWYCVNPTTALLGAGNIALYAVLYTRMKRKTIWNTWVGAVVGGIPPVMGWTACGGSLLPSVEYPIHLCPPSFLLLSDAISLPIEYANNPLGPLALFLLLFSWQFPHFNSFSHTVRSSYAQAGYQMLAVLNPRKNSLVSLRHALFLIPICSVLIPLSGMTTWAFALTSLVPNTIFSRYAWRFWKFGGEKEARNAFWASLWYLPVVMGLMMVHKNGLDWGNWLTFGEHNATEGVTERKDDGLNETTS